jgi:hypothetical protein
MSGPAAARLASMRGANLRELHAKGTCPPVTDLHGTIDGVVLNGRLSAPLVRELHLWRGKVFDRDEQGTVTGLNRLGVGPIEVRRYRFTALVAPSLFGDRDVVFLDHDTPRNPSYVRRFHDELVEIEQGLYLATSYYRSGENLKYLCHFALAKASER